MENINKLIFQGIKTIYMISNTFLSILLEHDTTLKVFRKVNREILSLKLGNSFVCY